MKKEVNYAIFKTEYNYHESLERGCSTEMYIGRTCDEEGRMRTHFNDKKPTLRIDKAIKAHGKDAFDHIILKTYPNEKECVLAEDHHMKLFNTLDDGYNDCPGGNWKIREKYGMPKERYTHIITHNDDQISVSTKPTGIYADPKLNDTHAVVFRIYIDGIGSYIDSSYHFRTHLIFLLYDNHNSPLKKVIKTYGRSAVKIEILDFTVEEELLTDKKRRIKEYDSINNGWNEVDISDHAIEKPLTVSIEDLNSIKNGRYKDWYIDRYDHAKGKWIRAVA